MIMLTRFSEKIFNPSRYTGTKLSEVEWFSGVNETENSHFKETEKPIYRSGIIDIKIIIVTK